MINIDLVYIFGAVIVGISLTNIVKTIFSNQRERGLGWILINVIVLLTIASMLYYTKSIYIPNVLNNLPDVTLLEKRQGIYALGKGKQRDAFYLTLKSDKMIIEVETSYYTYKSMNIGDKVKANNLDYQEARQLFND